MSSKHAQLNPKLFAPDAEQVPIRQGFGQGLLLAGEKDERVVALCADLTDSTKMNLFAETFPRRFVEVGVAEQNLVTVASGMAAMGKIPFVSSYAMFSPGRNWEQIRTTIAYNDRPVKIAGSHAGISVGPDGGTHQAIEDIALMRVIPRMVVLSPCDAIEAKKATLAAAGIDSPVYIRLAREKTPVITTENTPFEIGKALPVYDSTVDGNMKKATVGIVATGALVYQAILAARELEKDGIGSIVLNIHTIKPLDTKALAALAEETGAIVSVEEHQVAGGLGGAVAETLAQEHPVPMEFVGVADQFGQSGTPGELLEHYGMSVSMIREKAKKAVARKKK